MPHGRKRSYMKKSEETLEDFAISYPLDKLAPLEQVLFLDIETTGFTSRTSYLYMIGCATIGPVNGIPYNGWQRITHRRERFSLPSLTLRDPINIWFISTAITSTFPLSARNVPS